MTRKTLLIFLSFAMPAALAAAPRTMRVDYYHTGTASEERFSLDRVVVEPLPWPGNPQRSIDTTDRGKYLFEVIDAARGAGVEKVGIVTAAMRRAAGVQGN